MPLRSTSVDPAAHRMVRREIVQGVARDREARQAGAATSAEGGVDASTGSATVGRELGHPARRAAAADLEGGARVALRGARRCGRGGRERG